jgi:hypothetical protein
MRSIGTLMRARPVASTNSKASIGYRKPVPPYATDRSYDVRDESTYFRNAMVEGCALDVLRSQNRKCID